MRRLHTSGPLVALICLISVTACTPMSPTAVQGVTAGSQHTCAWRADGSVLCWGANTRGQLGDGSTTLRVAPTTVQIGGVSMVGAGGEHTCAVRNGAVWCWGRNDSGQLGDGTTVDRTTPVPAGALTDAVKVVGGSAHTCVLRGNGRVSCWGANVLGQSGQASFANVTTPTALPQISTATDIAAGDSHTCVTLATGEVQCWGSNGSGQLGSNVAFFSSTPTTVEGITGAQRLGAGGSSTCAVTFSSVQGQPDGQLFCWGDNANRQIGSPSFVGGESWSPVATPLVGIAAVDVGGSFGCATELPIPLRCWGANGVGQLGIGSTGAPVASPTLVAGLGGVSSLGAGGAHMCVVANNPPTVKCWGSNSAGQLGDGTTVDRSSPTQVNGL
jgi:alpha-tubulin suppressor-like RCC1 family protein